MENRFCEYDQGLVTRFKLLQSLIMSNRLSMANNNHGEAASGKVSGTRHVALNERILASMSHRSMAAHPWHDLEIGKNHFAPYLHFFFFLPLCVLELFQ